MQSEMIMFQVDAATIAAFIFLLLFKVQLVTFVVGSTSFT